MDVRELIARCIRDRNDTEAWTILCRLIEDVALPVIRRIIKVRYAALAHAEDILQELYLALLERNLHPLPAFQGACEPQLRAFLGIIARRFAGRALHRWQQQQQREKAAAAERFCENVGPTEHQLRVICDELERIL